MIGFLNYQCYCPGLNLSVLTECLRALPGAFPNRVFKSEKGYFSTMSLSMLETLGSSSETRVCGLPLPQLAQANPRDRRDANQSSFL